MNKRTILLLLNIVRLTFIEAYFFIYNTDRYSETDFEYDCIEYEIAGDNLLYRVETVGVSQSIRYCIRPSYRKDDNELVVEKHESIHHSWKKLTFKELYKKSGNITDNLLLSQGYTSIDTLERYKIYSETLNESLSEEEIYQCAGTWFGSECQYSLNARGGIHSTLDSVKAVYLENIIHTRSSKIKILEMTCYTNLICNRGLPPACLDWREICDGKIDCANDDGIDERFCEILDLVECSRDEYRCQNSRKCIQKEFFRDDPLNPDCQDASDEILDDSAKVYTYPNECDRDPAFRCEERACPPNKFACGDGQCVQYIHQCYNHRGQLLIMEFEIYNPKKPLSDCRYLLMSCSSHIESIEMCKTTCWAHSIRLCGSKLGQTCLSSVFRHSPATFRPSSDLNIFFHHDIISTNNYWIIVPHDDCFNDTYCYNTEIVSDDSHSYWCQYYQQQMPVSYIGSYSRSHLTDAIHRLQKACDRKLTFDSDSIYTSHIYTDGNRRENSIKFVYDNRSMRIVRLLTHYQLDSIDDKHKWSARFPYFKFCDRTQDLSTTIINNIKHTDENECDHWPNNTIYTRCNNHKNCSDNEEDFNFFQILCEYGTYLCISILHSTTACLLKDGILDGRIDCYGGIDEYNSCNDQFNSMPRPFYCTSSPRKCLDVKYVCDDIVHCAGGEDEYICKTIGIPLFLSMLNCEWPTESISIQSMMSPCANSSFKGMNILSLMNLRPYPSATAESIVTNPHNSSQFQLNNSTFVNRNTQIFKEKSDFYCHRGLDAYVALSHDRSLFERKCFCPPSYYGSRCQYQSDRISLTLQMQFSFNHQTIFVFLILLTDKKRNEIDSFVIHKHYPSEDCNTKFNYYLLYLSSMKNRTKNYFIHIDMFKQEDLSHYASWKLSINHHFLPVTRIAVLLKIPGEQSLSVKSRYCSLKCQHGQCMKYVNIEEYFCQCKPNWHGLLCDRMEYGDCSSHSIYMGSTNNRPICICKSYKFGPRCYFDSSCQETGCKNGGICTSLFDLKYGRESNRYRCICTEEFQGQYCEQRKSIVSFRFVNIEKYSFMIVHIISNITMQSHIQSSTFKKFRVNSNVEDLFISEIGINLIFVQLNTKYYLAVVQERNENSLHISTVVSPERLCYHISDLLNSTMVQSHPLKRLKYYPWLCFERTDLVCFHDERLMCICTTDHFAHCIDFAYDNNCTCQGENPCEREGRCFQDRPTCPSAVQCICSECDYGNRCQFSTNGLSISLDAILGYDIQPIKSLFKQSLTVKISMMITMIMFILGFLSSTMSLIAFRKGQSHEVGCGRYLLTLSFTSFLVINMFGLKFVFLLLTQISLLTHETFLYVHCLLMDILTKSCLDISSWLSACVAIERTVNVIRGIQFNKQQSKQIATWITTAVIICVISSHLPDPLYRVLLHVNEEQRIGCIVRYPSSIGTCSSINISLHCIIPSTINAISAVIIIIIKARIRFTAAKHEQSYTKLLIKQLKQLKHLLIAPSVIVVLFIPRLILAFVSGCMKSNENLWIYLTGYFISFVPPILIFPIYVLPSRMYKDEFRNQTKHLLKIITKPFRSLR